MKKLKVLDLFSGLGGFSLGLERTGHFETVAFCDNNKYSKLILDKHWKGIKIYDDIREITKEKFTTDGIETPDIITGGVPCQPFSVAGKQKGTSDDRYLWPEMFRLIKAFKSKFVIVENVRGIVNIENGMVFETVCSDLESEGYEVQPFNIPAAGVGAPHRRERIWFIAVREDVANTIGNNERREISRSYEEERRIQEEHRQNNSASRKFSGTSEIRNGDNGYEKRINVANANDEGVWTRIGGSDNDYETESRSRGTDGGRSTSDDERHNIASTEIKEVDVADTTSSRSSSKSIGNIGGVGEESSRKEEGRNQSSVRTPTRSSEKSYNVANTDTRLSNGENKKIQSRGQTSISSSEGTNKKLANTNSEGLEGFREGSCELSKTFFATDSSEERQRTMDQGWWSVEPNVGRVAHGVSGRVHRLKGLGNSIIPQIVEEIGYAIIKAMK